MFRLIVCSYLLLNVVHASLGDSSCIYDIGNGQKLDIRTLGNSDGKRAKYDQITISSPVPSTISWNGCFPFKKSDGGNCADAAACTTDKRSGMSSLIVKQSDVQFEHHDTVNLLVYQSASKKILQVFLNCRDSDQDTITAIQEDQDTFNINLQSRCCCPGKCQYSEGSSSLGAGAILVILFIVFLTVYLLGGMLYLRFARGASGVEMVPNRSMWINVTSYFIEGIRYSLNVIRSRRTDVNYEKV